MVLVAGQRRLEASRLLGWEKIECNVYVNMTDDEAEALEIVENLHRQDLTAKERRAQVKRLAVLWAPPKEDESGSNVPVSRKGGRGNKDVSSNIAKATGMSKRQVNRIRKEMDTEASTEKPNTEAPKAMKPAADDAEAAKANGKPAEDERSHAEKRSDLAEKLDDLIEQYKDVLTAPVITYIVTATAMLRNENRQPAENAPKAA